MYGYHRSGIFGYSLITGGYLGDWAEYCRVPNADLTYVETPKDIEASKGNAIGLSTQRLAMLRGASMVDAIGGDEHRLVITKSMRMIPVNVKEQLSGDPHDLGPSIEAGAQLNYSCYYESFGELWESRVTALTR
ncbi:NAD-dependent aldehyde dehydrogenase [Fusarium bulbicola]|nr:NAD-dependent aldehyde dehydrogenase [Fusarium bulbicola]